MSCRVGVNGEWYHFDGTAAEVAGSIGEAMAGHVQIPIAENRGFVVFGAHYAAAVIDTSSAGARASASN